MFVCFCFSFRILFGCFLTLLFHFLSFLPPYFPPSFSHPALHTPRPIILSTLLFSSSRPLLGTFVPPPAPQPSIGTKQFLVGNPHNFNIHGSSIALEGLCRAFVKPHSPSRSPFTVPSLSSPSLPLLPPFSPSFSPQSPSSLPFFRFSTSSSLAPFSLALL